MKEKKSVKEQVKEIWMGLTYHCRELSSLMVENADDPFFETSLGKEMCQYSAQLLLPHALGMMRLAMEPKDRDEDEDEDLGGSTKLEEMLKSLGTEFETD